LRQNFILIIITIYKIRDNFERLSREAVLLQEQIAEELRIWWRTDELNQSKPTVLDEADYTLHYFEAVLFDATPILYDRLLGALQESFPSLTPPKYNFCKFQYGINTSSKR
jgi:phosphoenolpyruvate carboxylase